MPISVLGLNHKTAPIHIRERCAFAPETLHASLQLIHQEAKLDDIAILSTCNRMEVYFRGPIDATDQVKLSLCQRHGFEKSELEPWLYVHQDEQAIRHLIRVATGLDSMVLGEPQILGQLKRCYQVAKEARTLGQILESFFQQTFAAAKKIRSGTDIGRNVVSVASTAVALGKKIFTDLSEVTALLVGAGETIELVARHLHSHQVNQLIIANRTLERGSSLADSLGAMAIGLGRMQEYLPQADIVISSTASQLPIIGKGLVESAIKQRKHKPMFMVDLAVPRDIETGVAKLKDVYLYSIDDLQQVIEQNVKSRHYAAEQAEPLVIEHAQQLIRWFNSLEHIDLVRDYRKKFETVKQQEIERSILQLQQGSKPEDVLSELAHRLTNKMMHAPTKFLREELSDESQKETLHLIQKVLGIDS